MDSFGDRGRKLCKDPESSGQLGPCLCPGKQELSEVGKERMLGIHRCGCRLVLCDRSNNSSVHEGK